MHWRVKGVIQGVLARLPGGNAINDALQATLGGRRNLQRHVDTKVVADWLVHMRHLGEAQVVVPDATLVEVGTGWIPVLPLCFSLAGARACLTFDLHRHIDGPATLATVAALEPHVRAIAAAAGLPEPEVRKRWQALRAAHSVEALLAEARIQYRAPADAAATGLPADTVDIVISNSVLEHVPAGILEPLMRESRRILRPGGVSIHSVNCGDHYAYFDRSITPIHYLRFSDREWRLWNNAILYQNRLRPRDFLAAVAHAGLALDAVHQRPRPELLAMLPTLPIAGQFRGYPPEELCTTSLDFVARKR